MGNGLFMGTKQPRSDVDHTPLPSAEVNERVELSLYIPPGSS